MLRQTEKRLLSASIKSRESFESVFSKILPESFSPVGKVTSELIEQYYNTDKDAKKAEKEVLCERVGLAKYSPKQIEAVQDYIKSLDPEISVPNLLLDIRLFKQQKLGEEIAMDLINGVENGSILEKMIEYQDLGLETDDNDKSEDVFVKYGVAKLVNTSFLKENLIKLLPKELNDKLEGGCRPGHHIVVYARPEIGKTLFVINLTAGFLIQGLKVLYIGNEDPASDILMRIVSRLSRMTKQQITDNPDEAEKRAFSKGYENLVVASLAPGNFFEIRKLVNEYSPKVVILDQLRNLDVSSESRVQALEKAAMEARNLAKKYGLVVVSVTQAGESAERKAILGRDDIDFSKTGIPATADLMVGIGADEIMENRGLRTISLPKNKISGNHEFFTVQINPHLGVVESA